MVRVLPIGPGELRPVTDAPAGQAVRVEARLPGTPPDPRHTRGVQAVQLTIATPAQPRGQPDARSFEERYAHEQLARMVGLPATARGTELMSRIAPQLDRLRERAIVAQRDVERMRAVLASEPGLADRYNRARYLLVHLRDGVKRATEELRRTNADPRERANFGRERAAELTKARAELLEAQRTLASNRPRFGHLDPTAVVANAERVMQAYQDLGRGLTFSMQADPTSAEARRLVFQENLFGRAMDAFDAGRALARSSWAADILLHSNTGAQAMPLDAVAVAIRTYGPATWPMVAQHRIIERLAAVQNDLAGNWEGLYRHRFELTPDGTGLTEASIRAFNRLVSPEDVTFYVYGNTGVLAPLRALMQLPAGQERNAMVTRLRDTNLHDILFRRLASRTSDGGGAGLQTAGSSQFGPVGEAMTELFTQVPELRPRFYERRYTTRLPEEVARLPAQWSIADWARANQGWDAPYWSLNGQNKGAQVHAFQDLARRL